MRWSLMMPVFVAAAAQPLLFAVAPPSSQPRPQPRPRMTADDRYPARDEERIQRSLAFAGTAARRLAVDTVFGAIDVAAYDGQTVEIAVTRTLKARTPELLERARKEVTLEVTEEASLIDLYVDGPFRDHDCDCGNRRRPGGDRPPRERRSREDPGYMVQYDFAIKVPRAVSLDLRTVTNGDVHVDGIVGDFDIDNVNGRIDVLDVAGSGRAHTVNGPVTVSFQRNPTKPSSFKSVNGEIVAYFDPGLQADLWMKTMNGKFYSDFDTTTLTALAPVAERDGGKFVYRFDSGTRLRVGRGGPALQFETRNGDIRILHRGR